MTDILVAGLDCRSLLLEAPVLQRQLGSLEEKATVRDLLDTLARNDGRCVVLGSLLPDQSLAEAIKKIRALPATRHVSILVVLGSDERAAVEAAALAAGANAVLRRPLDSGRLEDWVSKLLEVPRRVEARVPVQGQVVGTPHQKTNGHFYGLSRNLSVNGMLLASPVRLPEAPDLDLDLEFQLPEGVARIYALGRVVREAGEVGWPYLGYGVEFLFVPEESKDAIGQLVDRAAPPARAATSEGRGVMATVRRGSWIYEIVQPAPYEGGFLAEIRRGPREGWRPGVAGPYYVVEAASADAAVRAARSFVNRQE
ncbi:MAG TPA: PilZ domain-containing protein [Vicinamibacteria bacterium]|nr:PilZ domain-containing protein [Vicinamibacteria bacterium]